MIIDCISDLHGHYPKLDGGDLLIIAGDLTDNDSDQSHLDFIQWLHDQKYKKKIYIAGNHDHFLFDKTRHGYIKTDPKYNIDYLCDSGTEFEGLKIWGSPWTRSFYGMNPKCKAFTCHTEIELKDKFSLIPSDVDILITHCPPYGIFDLTSRMEEVGSISLNRIVLSNDRFTNLKLHVFGHVHECGGRKMHTSICFVNASIMNEVYDPVNKPLRVIL